MALIKIYQKVLSPLKPQCCRFYPSCSSYALEAVTRYGAVNGSILAVRRILKCHPFHPGGLDPVPNVLPWASFWHRKKQSANSVEAKECR